MRRWLQSSVAGLALMALAMPARAQVPVIDSSSITQLLNQLQQMKQDYQTFMGIYGTLLRVINPNSLATGLIGSQPMPISPNISQMMVGGGSLGSLTGLANQFKSANTVYTPQSTGSNDFNASFLQKTGNTLANVQAMLQQQITSIQSHITGLTTIQSSLSTATTQADLTAINGRLQAEQANLSAQGVQAQSLQTMLAAQQQQYELQQLQVQRQSADALLASVSGATTPGTTITAATIPTFSGP
jgi:hypothetical protein